MQGTYFGGVPVTLTVNTATKPSMAGRPLMATLRKQRNVSQLHWNDSTRGCSPVRVVDALTAILQQATDILDARLVRVIRP